MTADIETAGAMVTAGLVAHEIDGAGAPATARASEVHPANCANCGAALVGSFCHVCGQRSHLHRSLLHLGEEVLHGILHFDAKAWRTLPLLVAKPGELTRRYIDGQRTRFVSPLALFLFMIFFLFFVGSYFSAGSTNIGDTAGGAKAKAELVAEVAKAKAALEAKTKELAAARASGSATESLAEQAGELKSDLAGLEAALRVVVVANSTQPAAPRAQGQRNWDELNVTTGLSMIDNAVRHAKENPDLAIYKIKNTAYKFSFLLVPISLPFLWLMFFWRRGVTMYDHAVFSLYSLCFMSMLFATLFLLKYVGLGGAVAPMLLLVPPVHMFLQLRGTYGLTKMQTLWRTAVLLSVAATVFFLYLIVILLLSM
ncbi:DUF3667 domain-containing protein [Massilia cavernae]|uniref:DUF3667 domain-containing protein n=1 Tax=Massilia cavernae TaxID=2320864 RepID=A0A418Y838_9BURK|nr:DUF3667 domain-containing protein [Massilia cavernae]RJG27448.1 DUF3667 domain-containing protein [Massilia cavernae]